MTNREKLNRLIVQRDADKALLKSRLLRKSELIDELDTVLKSQVLLQKIAQETQALLSSKVDDIVNLGLAVCFPEYTFHLDYVPARGKTEVRFVFTNKDGNEIDIENQNGGGVIDVVTFCLRVAVYLITSTDNVIVMDEPFRFLSKGLREKIGQLLHTLSEKLGLQLLMVTHIPELAENSDKKIIIVKTSGVSNVSED